MPKINCNKISGIHNRFSSEDDIFMIEMKSNCGKKKENSQPKFEIEYKRLADLKGCV